MIIRQKGRPVKPPTRQEVVRTLDCHFVVCFQTNPRGSWPLRGTAATLACHNAVILTQDLAAA